MPARRRVHVEQEQAVVAAPAEGSIPSDMPKRILRGARLAMNTDLAPDQHRRIGIAGADAGEDLPLAQVTGVEAEAQQLVRAFDEVAFEHLADAQVHAREVLDADVRAVAGGRGGCGGAAAGLRGLRGFAGFAAACPPAALSPLGFRSSFEASTMSAMRAGSTRVSSGE
jgi:hypothetical protein